MDTRPQVARHTDTRSGEREIRTGKANDVMTWTEREKTIQTVYDTAAELLLKVAGHFPDDDSAEALLEALNDSFTDPWARE